jgi:hypothetical protein
LDLRVWGSASVVVLEHKESLCFL